MPRKKSIGQFLSNIEDYMLTLAGVAYYYIKLKKSDYLPYEKIRQYLNSMKDRMIDYATRNIPYYKRNGVEGIITKDIVLKNYQDFVNKKYYNSRHSIFVYTSGSTGKRLKMAIHKKQWIVEQASVWKHFKMAGYSFRDPMAIFRTYMPGPNEPFYKIDKVRNFVYFSPYHINDETIYHIVKIIKDSNVQYLRGYPSSIYLFAKVLRKNGLDISNQIKAIFVASETLYDVQKEFIEETFNAPIYIHYGMVEGVANFFTCEKGHLHVNEHYSYVEFLPYDKDRNLYKVIGTSLFNYTMPLINYDTGDLVELEECGCECGRTYRVVKKVLGREGDYLISDDGTLIPATNIYTFFSHIDGIKEFQMVQKAYNNELEVTIEVFENITKDSLEKIKAIIEDYIKRTLRINRYKLNFGKVKKVGEGKLRAVFREGNIEI